MENQPRDRVAIGAVILSIFGLAWTFLLYGISVFTLIIGLIGVIMAIWSRRKKGHSTLAMVGLVLSVINCAIYVVAYIIVLVITARA